jgi:hypothetical protein
VYIHIYIYIYICRPTHICYIPPPGMDLIPYIHKCIFLNMSYQYPCGDKLTQESNDFPVNEFFYHFHGYRKKSE